MTDDILDDNRRRESRRAYAQRCTLKVVAPSEALLSAPLDAETVNVTEHGIRLRITNFPTPRYSLWREILERDVYIEVEVRLRLDDSFGLRGQVVWINFDGNPRFPAGTLDAGVLLSLLNTDAARHYRKMLQQASESSDV